MGVVSSGWGRFAAAHPARRRPQAQGRDARAPLRRVPRRGRGRPGGRVPPPAVRALILVEKRPANAGGVGGPGRSSRRRPSRRVRGERVDQTRLGVTRAGPPPGSKDAPGAARQGGRGGARRARRRGVSSASGRRRPPPLRRFVVPRGRRTRRGGARAVVAEAAEAAAWMHAALVSCGACRGRRRRAGSLLRAGLFGGGDRDSLRTHDDARRDEPSSAGCWRSRLFAQRALAALLAPARPTSRRRAPRGVNGRSATPWRCGRSARGRMREPGIRPLAAALFSHRAMELAEGAPPSGPGAARVLGSGGRSATRRGRSEGDDPTRPRFAARPRGVRPARPGFALDAFFRRRRGWRAARRASFGERRRAGVEADARVRRGAFGCAMACAARLPRAARVSHDELSPFFAGDGTTTTGGGGVGADLRAARHALASCAAATVRWLAELIARVPACEVPGSIPRGVERIVAEGPVLAATAPHPCPARSPAWGGWTAATAAAAASDSLGARIAALLHRDGGPRGSACGSIVVAAAKRFASVDDSRVDGSPESAVVTPSAPELRRHHRGTHRGGPRRRRRRRRRASRRGARRADVPGGGAIFASELLPRFLARELRGTSQRRCARSGSPPSRSSSGSRGSPIPIPTPIPIEAASRLRRLRRPERRPARGGDGDARARGELVRGRARPSGDGGGGGAVRVRGREARRGGGPGRRDWSRRRDPGPVLSGPRRR